MRRRYTYWMAVAWPVWSAVACVSAAEDPRELAVVTSRDSAPADTDPMPEAMFIVRTTPGEPCASTRQTPFRRVELSDEGVAEPGSWLLAGGAVAVDDFDGNGLLDVFSPGDRGPRLYLQGPLDHYEDATEKMLGDIELGNTTGVSVVDADGDGDRDVFVTRWLESAVFLRNDRGERFVDATDEVGLRTPPRKLLTSAWGDVDGDGDLDVFVGGYGPDSTLPEPFHPSSDKSQLFRNTGDGRFVRAPNALPEVVHEGYTFMSAFVDLDLDQTPELYVINDFGAVSPQQVVSRVGRELTTDLAQTGLSSTIDGMGLGISDVNDDEVPDFLVSTQYAVHLFESQGDAWFDTTAVRGLATSVGLGDQQHFGWGAELVDFDNDGDQDAFAAFGSWSTYDGIREQRDGFWIQDDGVFVDESEAWGLADRGSTRGTAVADLNQDGWPDLVKRILDEPTVLYLSECGSAAWIHVRLVAPAPNTAGIGARVRVIAGDRVWSRQVLGAGRGMFSSSPPEVLVGLGDVAQIDEIEVHWPDGQVSRTGAMATRQRVIMERTRW